MQFLYLIEIKHLIKLLIIQIPHITILSILSLCCITSSYLPCSCFLMLKERYCSNYQCLDCPDRTPCLLMIVSKTRTDWIVYFKSSTLGEEFENWSCEWVVWGELKDTVVVTILVYSIKTKEIKMEVKLVLCGSPDNAVGDWIFKKSLLLLCES